MTSRGNNLPQFQATQLDFSAHIRDPDHNARPGDIDPQRMRVYVELFYNNIENFIASAFPVARQLLDDDRWHTLVREFVASHPSQSPYFLEISQEFLAFLSQRGLADLPAFWLELCHYEWVELALDVAEQPALPAYDPPDLSKQLVQNPCSRLLTYEYAVHEIGPTHQPREKPEQPTYLVVYRRASDEKVRFMASNPVTHRLLKLLEYQPAHEALAQIRQELNATGRAIGEEQIITQGQAIVGQLFKLGIVLGSK